MKTNPIDLIKEKNKQIDELAEMVMDKNVSEVDKHKALDNYLKELGALPSLMQQINQMKKGPSFVHKDNNN
jgi:hypothetical protein